MTVSVEQPAEETAETPVRRPGRVRQVASWVTTGLAGVLVLLALVGPNQPAHVTPAASLRLPAEGLLAAALLLALPARRRMVAALPIGALFGVLTVLKMIDIGFFGILDRPFDPVLDWSLFGPTMEFLGDTLGRPATIALAIGAVALAVAVLVFTPLAVRRLTPLLVRHRTRAAGTVAVLAAGWVACALLGVQIVPGAPVAAHNLDRVGEAYASWRDPDVFATELAIDDFHGVPDSRLLTALQGKDVVLTFIESYGRDAVLDPELAATVGPVLADGDRRLAAAGFASRSAFLTSPVVGGSSWLAHATLESGLWVDNQRRYDMLAESDRLTLIRAFQRAGWRTAGVQPGVTEEWASADAGYDVFYDNADLGYSGPKLNWSNVPDQYTFSFFERTERSQAQRPPLMAEIGLLSSHGPWPPAPPVLDWDTIGDGSVFNGMESDESDASPNQVVRDPDQARQAYIQTIAYSLRTLISYVETFGDDDLVMIFLGDHQPAPLVTGEGASRDVPISIVARDPALLDRIAGWGWQPGLHPGEQAPAWRMDEFRDRFLTAFGG